MDKNLANKQRKPFAVEKDPSEVFSLFNRNDSFIFDRKFYNTLPMNLTPPKSIFYSTSNENFAAFNAFNDLFLTKSNQYLYSDSCFNNNIDKEITENILSLIFKERPLNIIQDEAFKKEISKIINDEKEEQQPFKEKTEEKKKPSEIILKSYDATNEKLKITESKLTIKEKIKKTFKDIQKVDQKTLHPTKKNVFAEKIYDIEPFFEFTGINFNEIIFPNMSFEEFGHKNISKDYLLRRNPGIEAENLNEKCYTFYENEEDENVELCKDEDIKIKTYSYLRDYSSKQTNELETFNNYLLFFNDEDNKVKISQFTKKLFINKYKRLSSEGEKIDEEKITLNLKPVNYTDTEIDKKNELLKDFNVKGHFQKKDYEEIEKNLLSKKKHHRNRELSQDENEDDEDLFEDSEN